MRVQILVQWVVEQWCHAHCTEPCQPVVVSDVVVPRKWTEAVVAAAERICQEAAATATV